MDIQRLTGRRRTGHSSTVSIMKDIVQERGVAVGSLEFIIAHRLIVMMMINAGNLTSITSGLLGNSGTPQLQHSLQPCIPFKAQQSTVQRALEPSLVQHFRQHQSPSGLSAELQSCQHEPADK